MLGAETLAKVHTIVSKMSLPSWIGRTPHDLGSGRHGSLSADQWRTTCTTTLITALVPMWGSSADDTRERKILANFIDLVVATKIGLMRVMTKDRIDSFHEHMYRYLKTSQKLYPYHGIKPNQHLSLHFKPLLSDFGPTHAWRCYPFERYNYMLQKINTNNKAGMILVCIDSLELTFPQAKWNILCSDNSVWHRISEP